MGQPGLLRYLLDKRQLLDVHKQGDRASAAAAHGIDSCWRSSWTVSHGSNPILKQGKDSSAWAAAGKMCDELTITPIPCLSALLAGEEVELGRREGWGKAGLKIYFTSHYPALLLSVINSINIPGQLSFSHDGIWRVISPWPYLNSCPLVKGSDRVALVGARHPARVNSPHQFSPSPAVSWTCMMTLPVAGRTHDYSMLVFSWLRGLF